MRIQTHSLHFTHSALIFPSVVYMLFFALLIFSLVLFQIFYQVLLQLVVYSDFIHPRDWSMSYILVIGQLRIL